MEWCNEIRPWYLIDVLFFTKLNWDLNIFAKGSASGVL